MSHCTVVSQVVVSSSKAMPEAETFGDSLQSLDWNDGLNGIVDSQIQQKHNVIGILLIYSVYRHFG